MLRILLFSIIFLVSICVRNFAQGQNLNNADYEKNTKWLTKTIQTTDPLIQKSKYNESELRVSHIKFNGCEVKIEKTLIFYPKFRNNKRSTNSDDTDFMKDEKYQVDALKSSRSTTKISFSLADLDPEQIKVNRSPDPKIIQKNNKLVELILTTINQDRTIEYVEREIPKYAFQITLFVKPEAADKISQKFADVIKKCEGHK